MTQVNEAGLTSLVVVCSHQLLLLLALIGCQMLAMLAAKSDMLNKHV